MRARFVSDTLDMLGHLVTPDATWFLADCAKAVTFFIVFSRHGSWPIFLKPSHVRRRMCALQNLRASVDVRVECPPKEIAFSCFENVLLFREFSRHVLSQRCRS